MLDLWPVDVAERLRALQLGTGDVVALDGDGTLWWGDAGEAFLAYAAEKGALGPDPEGLLDQIRRVTSLDQEDGLQAQAMAFAGLEVARVEELARDFFREQLSASLHPAMAELLSWLHSLGVRVFLVTANFEHAVLPAAEHLGISPLRVIGVRLRVLEGVLQGLRIGPIPFRSGKARELHEHTGRAPRLVLASGSDDRELLEAATDLAIAVNPSPRQRRDGAASLARHAAEVGWPILRLPDPRP